MYVFRVEVLNVVVAQMTCVGWNEVEQLRFCEAVD